MTMMALHLVLACVFRVVATAVLVSVAAKKTLTTMGVGTPSFQKKMTRIAAGAAVATATVADRVSVSAHGVMPLAIASWSSFRFLVESGPLVVAVAAAAAVSQATVAFPPLALVGPCS